MPNEKLPPGVKLLHTLIGHQGDVNCCVVTPDGQKIVSASDDKTLKIWDLPNGKELLTLKGHMDAIFGCAVTPDGQKIVSASVDKTLKIWDLPSGKELNTLRGHSDYVLNCVVTPDGQKIVSSSADGTLKVWDLHSGKEFVTLRGHSDAIFGCAVTPDGQKIVSASVDKTLKIWNLPSGKELATLQGHSDSVYYIALTSDGERIISPSADETIKIWDLHRYEEITTISGHSAAVRCCAVTPDGQKIVSASYDNTLKVWEIDWEVLLGKSQAKTSVHYTNAKVVLVGKTSAGKTCLADALMGKPFQPRESTHGMQIWTYKSETQQRKDGNKINRETFLWDLAGQTDYQVVHQLFLDETALGLVLFDATHPDNTFAGVGFWEKSLRRVAGENCPRLLVAGRVDRGHPTASAAEIEAFRREHGFLDYVSTSAKTGEGVERLKEAIASAIYWDDLPVTSSPKLWNEIREHLMSRRSGDLRYALTSRAKLRDDFRRQREETRFENAEFDTVIRHAQAQGLIWPLSFGDFVLMQPELLNSYAAAVVRVARKQEEGLGCVLETDVLNAKIDFDDLSRLPDTEMERSLLHAVVELFLEREVAFRERDQLVFPSKFNRKLPDYPQPPLREVVYRFEGPVEVIYATLVVRLYYSGVFTKKDFWKNAAEFYCALGKICGLLLTSPDEGHGEISIFFQESVAIDTKVLFLQFIHEHLQRRALPKTVQRERVYRCPKCKVEVKDREAVKQRLEDNKKKIICQYCDAPISLIDLLEERFGDRELLRRVREMEEEAEKKKDQEVGETIAQAKINIREFDVFLAHNSQDKPEIIQIAEALKKRGLNPWLDIWNLTPGRKFRKEIEKVFPNIKTVAVFVGESGIGPWEDMEIDAALDLFTKDNRPIIPVLLPSAKTKPQLPLLLQPFTWVEFVKSIDDEAIDNLVWGITGEKPGIR